MTTIIDRNNDRRIGCVFNPREDLAFQAMLANNTGQQAIVPIKEFRNGAYGIYFYAIIPVTFNTVLFKETSSVLGFLDKYDESLKVTQGREAQ